MNKEVSEERTSEIAREFFLGEFSFDELEYVPANLSKGDKKELADLIIDYGDKTIAFQIKGRREMCIRDRCNPGQKVVRFPAFFLKVLPLQR